MATAITATGDTTDAYELMYSYGGHGGPHHGLEAATEYAIGQLNGLPYAASIYIVPRDSRVLDRKNAIRVVKKSCGQVTQEDFAWRKP